MSVSQTLVEIMEHAPTVILISPASVKMDGKEGRAARNTVIATEVLVKMEALARI